MANQSFDSGMPKSDITDVRNEESDLLLRTKFEIQDFLAKDSPVNERRQKMSKGLENLIDSNQKSIQQNQSIAIAPPTKRSSFLDEIVCITPDVSSVKPKPMFIKPEPVPIDSTPLVPNPTEMVGESIDQIDSPFQIVESHSIDKSKPASKPSSFLDEIVCLSSDDEVEKIPVPDTKPMFVKPEAGGGSSHTLFIYAGTESKCFVGEKLWEQFFAQISFAINEKDNQMIEEWNAAPSTESPPQVWSTTQSSKFVWFFYSYD